MAIASWNCFQLFLLSLPSKTNNWPGKTAVNRLASILLALLIPLILLGEAISILRPGMDPSPSFLGIGMLVVASFAMPWLARRKRALANETGSSALAADSVQSSVCGYLAWIALAGLIINAVFKLP